VSAVGFFTHFKYQFFRSLQVVVHGGAGFFRLMEENCVVDPEMQVGHNVDGIFILQGTELMHGDGFFQGLQVLI